MKRLLCLALLLAGPLLAPAADAPTPSSPTASQGALVPYGIPVPHKPGFVTSPHAPQSGYVDVRGFPVDAEVKCPYSGKTFLVPAPIE